MWRLKKSHKSPFQETPITTKEQTVQPEDAIVDTSFRPEFEIVRLI
jgi:hypothetical protein